MLICFVLFSIRNVWKALLNINIIAILGKLFFLEESNNKRIEKKNTSTLQLFDVLIRANNNINNGHSF